MTEHKVTHRLQLQATPNAEGFEIMFISAGEANGWTFPAEVLRESASLWEQCSVFVDHSMWGGRSVRDLGGVLDNINFNEQDQSLHANLYTAGPSREIVLEAAQVMLADGAHPDLGFSADLIFTADAGNVVQKIMQPLSVDLVIDPAFATKFIRQLNSKGATHMPEPIATPVPEKEEHTVAQAFQIAMGDQLLETALQNATLPEVASKALRSQFHGKLYKPEELTAAVQAFKDVIADKTAADEIVGPARISSMFNSADQLQAAVDDLVGAPRNPGAENLKVAQFQGIREAYTQLTGDREFVGGYFKDRVQFQSTTATFPGLVANALNKALVREWGQLGRAGYDWWQKIVTVEHFNSVNDIKWLIFGTVASLPTIGEGAEYPELVVGDGYEASTFLKKGGYIGLTLEALDRDDTRKLRQIPRELANAGLREISALVAAIFTQNSAAGPTMTDTGALFNAVAQTTKGGHKNLLTTAIGTDFTAWDAVASAMYNQPMLVANDTGYYGTGKVMAIEPKYCLVPRALKAAAEALFIPRWASTIEAAIAAKGGPTYGGYVEPITVPEWTDATDWAAVADPAVMPGIMIGERFGLVPQIFVAGSETDPAMFMNDESRIKVRHFITVGVADFRPLHKSNV